jgi:O-acetylserine/cysteine efflux transporter
VSRQSHSVSRRRHHGACGNLVTRAARPKPPLSLFVWSSVVAPVPLLGLSLVFEGTGRCRPRCLRSARPGSSLSPYVVGVVSTFFGYRVWYWLISRYPASTVAPFTLLVPVVGILTAWLVRGSIRRGASCSGLLSFSSASGSRSASSTLAVPRRTAARVPAPTPTPRT